jgi:RNA polymerase sigma factor (sigma-70 family)
MAAGQAGLVLKHVRKILAVYGGDQLSDRELRRRFAQEHDEAAFAAVVGRHGPMVLRVCQRVLYNWHDAEDAFQAAFLTLARLAAARRWQESVGQWLHLVASRLAVKLRADAERRARLETHAEQRSSADPLAMVSGRELCAVLDEELSRLPERFCGPLVLCCLEGLTRDEAARQCGWSLATLKRRLEQGRALLRQRLLRRGFPLPAVLAAVLGIDTTARAAVPLGLIRSAARIAVQAGSGKSLPAGLVSERVAALSGAVLKGLCLSKGKALLTLTLTVALALCVAGAGADLVFQHAPTEGTAEQQGGEPKAAAQAAGGPQAPGQPRAAFGQREAALPAGAFLRLKAGFTAALSPDGKTVASATIGDGIVHVWAVPSGKELRRYDGQEAVAWCLAFSPDGKTLALGGKGGDILLSEIATGKQLHRFAGYQKEIFSLVFSPDGKVLASKGLDPSIRLWDAAAGRELRRLEVETGSLYAPAFSPDSKTVATTCFMPGKEVKDWQYTIRIWDAATGKELHRFASQGYGFGSIAWSADGMVVAAASGRKQLIRLWEAKSGDELAPLAIPDSKVNCLAFSHDGRLLAVAGGHHDDSIYVLEVATHRERCRFRTATPGRKSLAFTPDGRILVSGGPDTFFWDVTGRLQSGQLRPARLPPEQLPVLWTDLGSADAPKVQSALWALVAAGEQSVPFLRKHLRPVPRPDAERLARLTRDLDNDQLAVRQQAAQELAELGDTAEPALRRGLQGTPSLELRRRIEQLLARLAEWPPDRLRALRAVEVLEQSGTTEAQRLLQELARGAPAARLTQEAKAALQRLAKRVAEP